MTIGLVLTVTLVALESLSVATILPVVSRHLGDVELYGWVFSAFFLASLIGIVTAGGLIDRGGLTFALGGGLCLFAAGLVIGGTAIDMPVLVAGRAVQGLGAGAVPATAYAVIGRAYPGDVRPRMLATLSTAWVVPGLVSPALAAVVADHFGWRWVFLGLVPVVGVAAALTLPAVAGVHGSPAGDRPLRTIPAVGAAFAAGLVLAGLTLDDPAPTALLVAAGGSGLLVTVRRLTPPGTLRARAGLPAAVLVRGLLTFGFFASDAYVPLTLTSVRHTSTTFAGLALTTATITWTSGSWVQARLVGRWGPRALVRGGLVLVVAGIAVMASVLSGRAPVALALVAWGIAGFGIGSAYAPTTLTVLDHARPEEVGEASASVQLTDVLGTALGTGIAGAAVAAGHRVGADPRVGLGAAFAVSAAVAVLGAVVSARLASALGRGPGTEPGTAPPTQGGEPAPAAAPSPDQAAGTG